MFIECIIFLKESAIYQERFYHETIAK